MKGLLYIFSLVALAISPHAGNVSFFSIHLDKVPNELVLEIESDYLGWMFDSYEQGLDTELAVNEYLNQHLKVYLNEELCLLNVCEIEPGKDGHTFINIQIHRDKNFDIKTMRIDNTCFLKEVEEHVNVIMIYQEEKEVRGFKMNKERKKIEVEL